MSWRPQKGEFYFTAQLIAICAKSYISPYFLRWSFLTLNSKKLENNMVGNINTVTWVSSELVRVHREQKLDPGEISLFLRRIFEHTHLEL